MRLLYWLVQAAAVVAFCGCSREPATAARPGETGLPLPSWPAKTLYRKVEVLGHEIFYREAGKPGRPVVLLLHGYPSSSHTYRELIPLLSGRYHVIAPDNLGSGFSARPSPHELTYSFDLLGRVITAFTETLNLDRYVLYMQDFGGPVGFRVAMSSPERVQALIVQNANAYLDGLTPPRQEFFRNARNARSAAEIASLAEWVSDNAIRNGQYLRDVPGPLARRMSPDAWTHDIAMLPSPDDRLIQVQLFQDYQTNVDAYPEWQRYLREHQPGLLVLWGERDPAFIAAGAHAYLRDVPDAELHLLSAGHFAVEEVPVQIAQLVTSFLERLGSAP